MRNRSDVYLLNIYLRLIAYTIKTVTPTEKAGQISRSLKQLGQLPEKADSHTERDRFFTRHLRIENEGGCIAGPSALFDRGITTYSLTLSDT